MNTNNFEDSVDKFDATESTGMEGDDKIIGQISNAANVLGERALRKEIGEIQKAYVAPSKIRIWQMGIAASILVAVAIYFLYPSNEGTGRLQQMQIEESPMLMDSSTFEQDSVIFITDSTKTEENNKQD